MPWKIMSIGVPELRDHWSRGEKVVDFERDIDCRSVWGDLGEQRHGGN